MKVVFSSLYFEACEFWIDRFGDDLQCYGIDRDILSGRYHVIQF